MYLGKKRKYITLMLDLGTGRVIHIGKGKGKGALKGFWRRLRRSKAKVEAVATDMASGYIAAVLELNQPLAIAYYMKERLRLLFQCADKDKAEAELTAWIREAAASAIRILKDAARQLLIWKPFILNWHNHRISTGKLEAISCKIGTLQRNAYGYRDKEYLKLRIFNLHNSTYALSG